MFDHRSSMNPCQWRHASTGWITTMANNCLIFTARYSVKSFPWILHWILIIILHSSVPCFTNEVQRDQAAFPRSVRGSPVIQKQVRLKAEVVCSPLCSAASTSKTLIRDSYTSRKQASHTNPRLYKPWSFFQFLRLVEAGWWELDRLDKWVRW